MFANVRKCPQCSIFVSKQDGCLHVMCQRCQLAFCWSCMGPLSRHSQCHRLCPELPFSMGSNIVITWAVLLQLPLLTLFGPLLYSLFLALAQGVPSTFKYFRQQKKYGCCIALIITILLLVLLIVPLTIIGGVLASVVITVVGIIPFYFWTLSYLLRISYHYSRLLCCV